MNCVALPTAFKACPKRFACRIPLTIEPVKLPVEPLAALAFRPRDPNELIILPNAPVVWFRAVIIRLIRVFAILFLPSFFFYLHRFQMNRQHFMKALERNVFVLFKSGKTLAVDVIAEF